MLYQNFRTVRCCKNNNTFGCIKSIHLCKYSYSVSAHAHHCHRHIPLSRLLPIASISSIKIIHGAICCACLNRSRTLDAPTPTNISTKSEPERKRTDTFASPATALPAMSYLFPEVRQAVHPSEASHRSLVYFPDYEENLPLPEGFLRFILSGNISNVTPVLLLHIYILAFQYRININMCPVCTKFSNLDLISTPRLSPISDHIISKTSCRVCKIKCFPLLFIDQFP